MSIVEKPTDDVAQSREWRISNQALDLLQCFMAEIDDIIIQVALDITKAKFVGKAESELRIGAEEIQQAANIVLDNLKTRTDLPPALRAHIDSMNECLKKKCQALS